jgi:hypothetical protein
MLCYVMLCYGYILVAALMHFMARPCSDLSKPFLSFPAVERICNRTGFEQINVAQSGPTLRFKSVGNA